MKKFYPLIFLGFITLFITFILNDFIQYSRNALLAHPQWISGKRLVPEPMMGSIEGFYTRNLLHKNRLNMHEMHGFNEILLNKIFHLGSMSFKFNLSENGYLNLIFNKNKDGFSGIRISRNSKFPNIYFHSSFAAEFLSKKPFQDISLSDGWHRAQLKFSSDTLILVIDGQLIERFSAASTDKQIVGFRSGKDELMIDDVEVLDFEGNQIISESFCNMQGYWKSFFLYFMLAICFFGLGFIISYRLNRNMQISSFRILLLQFLIIIFLVMFYGFDYYYWSKMYHYSSVQEWGEVELGKHIGRVESYRGIFFSKFPFYNPYLKSNINYTPESIIEFLKVKPGNSVRTIDLKVVRDDAGPERVNIISSNRDSSQLYLNKEPFSGGLRILLLGTSQTWGSGANFWQDRIEVQLRKVLSDYFQTFDHVYVINASKRASNSSALLKRYEDHLDLFEPDLVIINLSNNDRDPEKFRENLHKFIESIKNNKSQALLVVEPNSFEIVEERLNINHNIVLEVAAEKNVFCLNLSKNLSETGIYDSGILWWDRVHLTSYGQKLAANLIGNSIIENYDFSD